MSAPQSEGSAPDHRPLHGSSNEPREAVLQPGYYPGFSTLDQQSFWDDATRTKILERVSKIPEPEFFKDNETALLKNVAEHILPQGDRLNARRIPIVPWIDERLAQSRIPGYRYDTMPPDGEAYRLGLQAIEQMAQGSYGRPYFELSWREQESILKSMHDGHPREGASSIWERMPVKRFWALLVQDCVDVYYAHPWAWDEIGFGGPAYPRGYMRLENGEREPWEVTEQRYSWRAPVEALSDPAGWDLPDLEESEGTSGGQGGTH